jgi:hypothetical protein
MHFHLTRRTDCDPGRGARDAADNWPIDRIHAFADGDADFDPASWQALMALGIGGILLPDSGMGLLDAALACEVAGEAAAPGPLIGQLPRRRRRRGERQGRCRSAGERAGDCDAGPRR